MSDFSFPIHLVDDDPAFVKALSRLLRLSGFEVITYSSATDFLNRREGTIPGCILLDMSMPGPSGLELHEAIGRMEDALPVVFVSGHGDVVSTARAMKTGAVDFLSVLTSFTGLLDQEMSYLESLSEYYVAIAKLEAVTGATETP